MNCEIVALSVHLEKVEEEIKDFKKKLKTKEKEWLLKEKACKEEIKGHKVTSEKNAGDKNKIRAMQDELEHVKKESNKLDKRLIEFRGILEQSNNVIEECKT